MSHPRVQIKTTTLDIILEVSSWTLLLMLWFITAMNYFSLPEIIPIHFNFSGEADGHAGKLAYWMFPVITTGLFILLNLISRYPHALNYPVKITENNAVKQYGIATRFIRLMRLVIVGIFLYAVVSVASIANDETATSSLLPVWGMLALLICMILIYMRLSYINK